MTTGSTTSETKRRRQRFIRNPAGLPETITPRDTQMIQAVYDYRVLSTPQLYTLFFTPTLPTQQPSLLTPTTSCRRRLQRLWQHGFLARREQKVRLCSEGTKPILYLLDVRGARLLAQLYDRDETDLAWQPADNKHDTDFFEHFSASNDIRIAVTLAAKHGGYQLSVWHDEMTLKSPQMKDYVLLETSTGKKKKSAVVPDNYFVLATDTHVYHHFVETDRGTVTGEASSWDKRDWAERVKTYLAYHTSGKYQERYGSSGLRILTVTTSDRRLANLKRITEEAGGTFRFWFTTFAQASPAAILTEPIWSVASKDNLYSLMR